MDERYAAYLILLAVIVIGTALAAGLFLYWLGRMKNRKDSLKKDEKPVDGGNVSIFFDKQRNAVIIPYVADLFGNGKATTDILELQMPYKPDVLGENIKRAMISCKNARPANNADVMSRLGASGWKEFSQGKLSVSIYFAEDKGILFNSTARTTEGAYVFNIRGPEASLRADAGNEEIGATALELLKRCR